MKLSAAVMAHPDRSGEVTQLQAALDRPVPVHWDPEGPPSGNGDRVWRVAREAWLLADPAADWHVLIQDDAIPCADLLAGLENALTFVPARSLVSPYLGTGRTVPNRWALMAAAAEERAAVWVRTQKLMWGVCLVAPVALIPEMVDWCDRKAGMPDDMRVSAWFARQGLETWYTWPSLVDHRAVPSLTKHKAAERVARRHHTGSALEINWSGPVVTDPMLVRRAGPRSGPSRLRAVRSAATSRTGKAGTGE